VLAGEARQVKSGLVQSCPARSSQVGGGQTRRWRGSRRRTERGQSWRRPNAPALALALARHGKAACICIAAMAYYISSASPQTARLLVPGQRVSAASAIRKKSEHRKQASSATGSPLRPSNRRARRRGAEAREALYFPIAPCPHLHRLKRALRPPWMPSLVVEPLCHLRRYTSPSDEIEPVA
jgi:hypothetical protein